MAGTIIADSIQADTGSAAVSILSNTGTTVMTFGQRITGDFSNATIANRVMFQTSTANSPTVVSAIPNGTSAIAQIQLFNNSDPTNAGRLQFSVGSTEAQILSSISGTGTYLPMTFYTGGSEQMRIDTSGNVGIGTFTVSPPDRLTVAGLGETGAPADGGSKAASIRVASTAGNANDGGQIEFGAGFGTFSQSYFSAIKGLLSNSTGNTLGSLAFYTRNATGDTSLTERARITSDGLFQFNSGYGSVATAYACRAWVNFNGTGTVAIRASGNVSSITDNGVGKFGINFTNAMPDANYSVVGTQNYSDDNADTALNIVAQIRRITTPLTTTVANVVTSYNQTLHDPTIACFSVFR